MGNRKSIAIVLISFILCMWCMPGMGNAGDKDLEIRGRKLISHKPPFTLNLPSEFQKVHFSSTEHPQENSLTRAYFFIKAKNKQVEEMFILQIADRTNPLALPMTAPPLKPYTEKRMYSKGKIKKGNVEIEHLTQLLAWNPASKSLQPIVQRGIAIPHQWALQGQFQFIYLGEHGVLFRYSKEVNSFGMKVSGDGKDWEKGAISGNEKKVYETFQNGFMGVVNSIRIQ